MGANGNINDLELAKFIELAGQYGIRVHILHGDSWLPSVANLAALPSVGNTTGDIRQALDTGTPYRWNGSAWAVWSTSGTSWGSIAGTLADQTDLQTALDAKMGAGAYVLVSQDSLLTNQINLGSLTSGILKQTVAAGISTISILTDNSGNWNIAYTHSQNTTTNPHNVTKTQVGLGNADNTSDANKPVSTAQQTALNLKQDTSGKDATGGYAGLTLFKINFKNALNTLTSFFTNSNTAARTYTFQDRDGTIADDTDLALKAPLASPTFTGTVTVPTPSAGTDATNKSYVDTLFQGGRTKEAVKLATTTTLPTNTYNNGASGVGATLTANAVGILTIDGTNVVLNDRILVKDEAAPANNGIYVCTTEGTAGVAYVLTRSTNMDTTGEIEGAYTFVESGTANSNNGYVVTGTGPWTIGTTSISWTQNSGLGQVIAGSGISKTGNNISIDTAVTASLTATQTFGTGIKTFLSGMFALRNVGNTFSVFFTNTVSANRTITLRDSDGTIAYTSDFSGTNTGDETLATLGTKQFATSGKTTPVDADSFNIFDSAASNVLKLLTFTNLKAFLKTWIDSLTTTFTNKTIALGSNTVSGTKAQFNTANTDGDFMFLDSADTVSGVKTFLSGMMGLRNIANTFTSFFSNTATASRTWTLQDRNGILADDTDLALKANLANPTFTGTVTLPTGLTGVLRADSGVVSTDSDVTDLVSAASTTAAGKVELATTAEINTGTDSTRAMPIDQYVASNRNVRYIDIYAIEKATDNAVGTNIVGSFECPFTGTITEIGAYVETAGVTGTSVWDVNKNGTTIMTTNKLSIDSAEVSTRSAATAPTLTTTAITAGDLITIDTDSLSTTKPKGLHVRIGIRLS